MSFRDLIKKRKDDGGDAIKSILAEKGARVECIIIKTGDGDYNYFYMLMAEAEYQRMHRDVKVPKVISPSEYGFIIYQGFGANPPDEIDKTVLELFK